MRNNFRTIKYLVLIYVTLIQKSNVQVFGLIRVRILQRSLN